MEGTNPEAPVLDFHQEGLEITRIALCHIGPRRALCLISAFRAEHEGIELDIEESAAYDASFAAVRFERRRLETPDHVFGVKPDSRDIVDLAVANFFSEREAALIQRALKATHVVQLGAQRVDACLDVAQALAVSKLRKGHGQILIPTSEAAQAGVAVVTSYSTTKFPIRQKGDQLREHRATLVHKPLSAASKPAPGTGRRSNRGKAKIAARR